MHVEPIAGVKTDCSSQQKQGKRNDKHVPIVQQQGHKTMHFHFGQMIPNRVQHSVTCTCTGMQERSPPPTVILAAQLEIAQENGDLSTSEHQQNHDQKQEAKDIVHLMQPQGRHDEKQLH